MGAQNLLVVQRPGIGNSVVRGRGSELHLLALQASGSLQEKGCTIGQTRAVGQGASISRPRTYDLFRRVKRETGVAGSVCAFEPDIDVVSFLVADIQHNPATVR